MRNVKKQAEQGRAAIPYKADLTATELQQFMQIIEDKPKVIDGIYDVILTAFYMGFAVGQRN